MSEIESIGISDTLLKADKVLLKGRKGSSNNAYRLSETGNHTKDIYSLFTGEYNTYNEFCKGLTNFTGERVVQNVQTSKDYPAATLSFSDGSSTHVRSDCGLSFSLLNGSRIEMDEDLMMDETDVKGYFQKRIERDIEEAKRKVEGFDLNKEIEALYNRSSQLVFEKFMKDVEECKFKPVKSLGYETKRLIPYVTDGNYTKCTLTDLTFGIIVPDSNARLFGTFKSGRGIYYIPMPVSFSFMKNMSNFNNGAIDFLRGLQENAGMIEDCGTVMEHMLNRSGTCISNVYIDAKGLSFLKIDPLDGSREDTTTLEPKKCLVKLQRGERIEILEAPCEVGLFLWSKTRDNLMVSMQKEGQPIPVS